MGKHNIPYAVSWVMYGKMQTQHRCTKEAAYDLAHRVEKHGYAATVQELGCGRMLEAM